MIIIGEKISGFVPRMDRAITQRDGAYIQRLALKQSEAGAHYIDCCPAVEENALEIMQWMISEIQSACKTPISIDSSDADVLIEAMQCCDKPGLINSASLAANKIDKIFAAIAHTDWSCIVMLDRDSGVPKSLDEYMEVLEEVLSKANQYHIDTQRLFLDPLVDTLSTNDQSLLSFIQVCQAIKKRCPHVHITSGLSNISFGLPARKMINMSFLALAMQAGMDSAIIDPLNRDMLGIAYATQALLGNDPHCKKYTEAYGEKVFDSLK